MTPFWLSAFLDFAPAEHEEGARFWAGVTGYALSPSRGESGEFATLEPRIGDDYLRVQRLGAGPSLVHLDLHVSDPRAAADAAIEYGAREVADRGHVVLASPGGLTFCYVAHPGSVTPPPATWTDEVGMHASRVDQVCLDLPVETYPGEVAFWTHVLGAPVVPSPTHAEFARITPPWSALEVLVQRLEEPSGPPRLHLDLASRHRAHEVARHVGLGGRVVAERDGWTVLRDPAGLPYCVTSRVPR